MLQITLLRWARNRLPARVSHLRIQANQSEVQGTLSCVISVGTKAVLDHFSLAKVFGMPGLTPVETSEDGTRHQGLKGKFHPRESCEGGILGHIFCNGGTACGKGQRSRACTVDSIKSQQKTQLATATRLRHCCQDKYKLDSEQRQ